MHSNKFLHAAPPAIVNRLRPVTRARTIALLLPLAAASLQAAVIRGTVVEKMTGYLLSRAVVTLQPIGAPDQATRVIRSTDTGQFEFPELDPGSYLITVNRRGFLPFEYGQRRWNSAGLPLKIDRDTTATLRLALSRYGTINGTVRDSNEAGIPVQDVAAYTATQPPLLVSRTKSDDRGIYRLSGLPPGTYLVRTTGNEDDDRTYRPTFSRQTPRAEDARTFVVYPDEDTGDGDVRPLLGPLFIISGSAPTPLQPGYQVTVTLASDMGRIVSLGPDFKFGPLPPGRYELYAEGRGGPGQNMVGAYADIQLERNLTNFTLSMRQVVEGQIVLEGAGPTVAASALYRRLDLAGAGPTQSMKLSAVGRILLAPGRWEILTTPPEGYYVSRFANSRNNARPEGWSEIQASGQTRWTITFSKGGASLHGAVRLLGSPVPGAPVFLEAWDPATRKRLIDPRRTRADGNGNYRFDGLPPGNYRILATWEYSAPDAAAMDASQPLSFRLDPGVDYPLNLDLFGTP